MTAIADLASETEVFAALMDVSLTDTDRASGAGWCSDTRLSLLAWEIARYEPELAEQLTTAGRLRLALHRFDLHKGF